MKAVIYYQTGGTEVLKYEDVADPEVGINDVLVRVRATSINQLDLRLRSGKSPRPVELPHVGGIDIAGEIEEVGSGVTGLRKGMRVVVNPTIKTISPRTGRAVLALNRVIGVNLWGGFAEYVRVPAENVVEIPNGLSFDAASTLPICFVTAWYGLLNRGGLGAGETVVVHAAGSGTGSAAIQVAKLAGAHVIATAGSDEKLERARELGADETINYNTTDVLEGIRKATEKGGVDLIFDPIGGSMLEKNVQSLAPGGRLLLIGVVGGGSAPANLGPLIMREISILGVTVFNAGNAELARVAGEMARGRLKPVIHSTLPLSQAREGQELLAERKQFGKVVLNP